MGKKEELQQELDSILRQEKFKQREERKRLKKITEDSLRECRGYISSFIWGRNVEAIIDNQVSSRFGYGTNGGYGEPQQMWCLFFKNGPCIESIFDNHKLTGYEISYTYTHFQDFEISEDVYYRLDNGSCIPYLEFLYIEELVEFIQKHKFKKISSNIDFSPYIKLSKLLTGESYDLYRKQK